VAVAAADPVLRLFVALVPSDAVRRLLAREIRHVGDAAPRARLVRPEHVHLTLHFLGATPASAVPAIEHALRAAARDVAPLPWRLQGLGAFPTRDRPRVVWAGVDPSVGADEVCALAGRVSRALATVDGPSGAEAAGDVGAERFHPHLTLARLEPPQPPPALKSLLTRGTLQDTYNPEVASDLALMVSEFSERFSERNDGSGVRYRALATVPFGAAPSGGSQGTPQRA